MGRHAAILVVVGALLGACGTTTIGSTAPRACHANGDCPPGDSCQFAVYSSCGSAGACLPNPDGSACVPQTACGCDGVTRATCLVNGNAPSPIASLGSCDGALQQPVFDASMGQMTVDSSAPEHPDAADAADAQEPVDSSQPVDLGHADRLESRVDAADATPASTYGSPCMMNSDCTDPVYNQCVLETCTKNCSHNSECPDPPTLGTCSFGTCD